MKTYIQIGANVGNDEFYQKICNLKEPINLYLIEANPYLIENLKQNYLKNLNNFNIHFINAAIVPHKEQQKVNLFCGSSDQFSSLLDRKSFHLNAGSIEVDAMTFNELISQFNIKNIELLFIDTEGLDYSIINSIDINLYIIKQIECEIWPYDIDSSPSFSTGPTFLNNVLIPKMSEKYNIEIKTTSIIFTRKEN